MSLKIVLECEGIDPEPTTLHTMTVLLERNPRDHGAILVAPNENIDYYVSHNLALTGFNTLLHNITILPV